jgi:hypothetical protein
MGVQEMAAHFKDVIREWYRLEGTPTAWRDRHYWERALLWATALRIGADQWRMVALTMALKHDAPINAIARGLDVPPNAGAIRELWEPWALGEIAKYAQGQGALSQEQFETILGRLAAAERPET